MCSQSGRPRDVERYRLKDVTARRQAEEDLRAARRHLEYVLSMSPAVTYVLKLLPDGRVRTDWTSENIERLTGFCLLYTSPSPRDGLLSRMPSSA